MSLEPLQELRALLASPGHTSWGVLCQRFLSEELLPLVSQEVASRLGSWSDELRLVPPAWLLRPEAALARFFRAVSVDASLLPGVDLGVLFSSYPGLRCVELAHLESASALPDSLVALRLRRASVPSLSSLPGSLTHLSVQQGALSSLSLSMLPRGLHHLEITQSELCVFDVEGGAPMLQSLSLASNPLTQESLRGLWACESLPMLRSLALSGVSGAAEPLYFHAKGAPLGRSLQALSLNGCGINDEQVESLVRRGESLPLLQELHLSQNPITEDGLSALGRSLVGKRLRALSLSANEQLVGFELCLFSLLRALSLSSTPSGASSVSAECLRELPWERLESLSLPHLSLGDELVELLSEVPLRVAQLDLRGNALSPGGLRRLLLQCDLKGVKELSLAHNDLRSAVAFLAEYESVYRVERLDLSATGLDEVGLFALCDWLTSLLDEGLGLRALRLSHNALSPQMLSTLAECRGASLLRELYLDGCEIGAEGLALLQGSPHLTQLRTLSLQGCSAQGALGALLQDDARLRLEKVYLSDTESTRELCQRGLSSLTRPLSISLVSERSASSTSGSSP